MSEHGLPLFCALLGKAFIPKRTSRSKVAARGPAFMSMFQPAGRREGYQGYIPFLKEMIRLAYVFGQNFK